MMTINEQANKEIIKAIRTLDRALTLLENEPAYINRGDIFHASAVQAVNRLITAIETLND